MAEKFTSTPPTTQQAAGQAAMDGATRDNIMAPAILQHDNAAETGTQQTNTTHTERFIYRLTYSVVRVDLDNMDDQVVAKDVIETATLTSGQKPAIGNNSCSSIAKMIICANSGYSLASRGRQCEDHDEYARRFLAHRHQW